MILRLLALGIMSAGALLACEREHKSPRRVLPEVDRTMDPPQTEIDRNQADLSVKKVRNNGNALIKSALANEEASQWLSKLISGADVADLKTKISGMEIKIAEHPDKGQSVFYMLELSISVAPKAEVIHFSGVAGTRLYSERKADGQRKSELIVESTCADEACKTVLIKLNNLKSSDPAAKLDSVFLADTEKNRIIFPLLNETSTKLSWMYTLTLAEALEHHRKNLGGTLIASSKFFEKSTGIVILCDRAVSREDCEAKISELAQHKDIESVKGSIIKYAIISDRTSVQVKNIDSGLEPAVVLPVRTSFEELKETLAKLDRSDSPAAAARAEKVARFEALAKSIEDAGALKIKIMPSAGLSLDELIEGTTKLSAIAADIHQFSSVVDAKAVYRIYIVVNEVSDDKIAGNDEKALLIRVNSKASVEEMRTQVTAALQKVLAPTKNKNPL